MDRVDLGRREIDLVQDLYHVNQAKNVKTIFRKNNTTLHATPYIPYKSEK
jgi:hypothetical protein